MCFPTSLYMASWPHWQWRPVYPAGLPYDDAGPWFNWPNGCNAKKMSLLTAPISLDGWCLEWQPWDLQGAGWPSLPYSFVLLHLFVGNREKRWTVSPQRWPVWTQTAHWKCHQNTSGFISMCVLVVYRNKRERVGGFLKREGKREWERDWTEIFQNRD